MTPVLALTATQALRDDAERLATSPGFTDIIPLEHYPPRARVDCFGALERLRQFTPLELLHAFASMEGRLDTTSRAARTLVNESLDTADQAQLIDDISSFTNEHRDPFIVVHQLFFSRKPVPFWNEAVLKSDLPGRLTKEMFYAARFEIGARTSYLRRRLSHAAAPQLTDAEREFARMFAKEWTGTLDSLVETARALAARPKHAHDNG
jgi:hypothetical protein